MSALLWRCALLVGVVVGSLHDDEPMQTDEPLTVRGDAPRGLFTPRWAELRQTYGIERALGLRSEIFIRFSICRHGRGWWPHRTSGLMNLLMTSLVGLMT